MLSHHSISTKLTWMNMLVSAAALLLACTAFIGYDLFTFRTGTFNNLSIQAQIIGSNVVSALVFDDAASAKTTLSALQSSRNIIAAGILDTNGKTFALYSRNPSSQIPPMPAIPDGQVETHRVGSRDVVFVRSIIFDGRPAGSIFLISDSQRMNARLWLYVEISAVVLVISLLGALLISPIFSRAIAEPIVQLAGTASMVSREKNYSVRATPSGDRDEIAVLIDTFNGMLSQIQERDVALQQNQDELEKRVQHRTAELATINKELESFSYSVSHDLRAPLRSIDGFSQALFEDYGEKLDATGLDHLQRVRRAAQHMATLIDDMLNLSRVTRSSMRSENLDLSGVVESIAEDLHESEPERQVDFVIEKDLKIVGDGQLLRAAMENLLRNAWKYTSSHSRARIEFGRSACNGKSTFFVRDDGAGFDPRYADRLFGVFQRLHTTAEFPGTGIGLATVQRIIHRHGGEIWAEGAVEKGATFYFSL